MSKTTTTFTADATLTELKKCIQTRGKDAYTATLQIDGTFGAGTLALFLSLDGGTTKTALKDVSGTAYTTTTADIFRVTLDVTGSDIEKTFIYGSLSGATAPNLKVIVCDNI